MRYAERMAGREAPIGLHDAVQAKLVKSSSPFRGEVYAEGVRRGEIDHFSQKNIDVADIGVRRGMGTRNINNLPHLKTFRKELRKNLTPAEARLWTLVKGKQLEGRMNPSVSKLTAPLNGEQPEETKHESPKDLRLLCCIRHLR
jgi:hypothetical protein